MTIAAAMTAQAAAERDVAAAVRGVELIESELRRTNRFAMAYGRLLVKLDDARNGVDARIAALRVARGNVYYALNPDAA